MPLGGFTVVQVPRRIRCSEFFYSRIKQRQAWELVDINKGQAIYDGRVCRVGSGSPSGLAVEPLLLKRRSRAL